MTEQLETSKKLMNQLNRTWDEKVMDTEALQASCYSHSAITSTNATTERPAGFVSRYGYCYEGRRRFGSIYVIYTALYYYRRHGCHYAEDLSSPSQS